MNAVLDADPGRKLSASQKFVLLLLANNANEEGYAFPSVPTMSRYSNLDDRTVQRAIVALEEAGHITIKRRAGRATIYLLHPDRPARTPGTVTGVTLTPAQNQVSAENTGSPEVAAPATDERELQRPAAVTNETNSGDPHNPAPDTPGTMTGVGLSVTCGSVIHTPGEVTPRGDIVPGAPPAGCHPPPAGCHPESSLNPSEEPSLNLRGPDVLKNGSSNPERKRIQIPNERKRSACATPLSNEDLERGRQNQLRRIEQVLATKAGG